MYRAQQCLVGVLVLATRILEADFYLLKCSDASEETHRTTLYPFSATSYDTREHLFPFPAEVFLRNDDTDRHRAFMSRSVIVAHVDVNTLQFISQDNISSAVEWALVRFCKRLPVVSDSTSDRQTVAPSIRRIEIDCSNCGHGLDAGPPHLHMNETYELIVVPDDHTGFTSDGPVSALRATSRHGLNRGLETLLQVPTTEGG